MFADSTRKFQMKVRFNLSKARLSQLIFSELLSGDAVDLVYIGREITATLAFGFEAKSFAKRNLIKLFPLACWQNRRNITACETQFQHFVLLRFRSFIFRERDY